MYRLRLFGGLTLEDDSGAHTGKASQRRRLAVLALLETAPRRTLTRDKLLGLLWSDEDAEHARHRLSVLLHEVRKALGEDAIRSVGDDVTLDPGVVGSDVADFNAAIAAGDYSRAVSLYDGPFLDGVYLSGAPDFERWVDGERDRFDRAYKQALERLAETQEAAGEWRSAVETWRKLTMADRYNTRVALRCMNAMARAGDSAGAIQFARVHELLVKDDLGVGPGPELQSFVEQIERGEIGAAGKPSEVRPTVSVPAAVPAPPQTVQTAEVSSPREKLPRKHLRFRRSQRGTAFISIAAMVAVFIVIGVIIFRLGGPSEGEAQSDTPIRVGVLPFRNLSDNAANQHLADGLTDEILSTLAAIEALHVPSLNTVLTYKGRNVTLQQAAQELDSKYVMEGSVRVAGGDLRVTVNLSDGKEERQIWTRTYDRRMDDILQVQKEIARDAVHALQTRLGLPLKVRERNYTRDPEAYDLYLRGRAAWYSREPNRLQLALGYFNEAIKRDSTYALAYSGIADVYNMFGAYNYGLAPPAKVYPAARAAAAKALELDPDLAEAHAAFGNYLYNYEWKWEQAERELQTARRLNPGYTMAQHWLELVLLISGKKEEALEVIRKAREQDPRSPLISSALAHHYYYRREFDKAIAEYKHSIELDPTFIVARLGLGMSYTAAGNHELAIEQLRMADKLVGPHSPVAISVLGYALGSAGQIDEARQILAKLQADAKKAYVAPHFFALLHIGLRDYESTLRALEAAYEERSGVLLYIPFEPPLDPLRNHPRFKALIERVHGTTE